jgi:hypothetical protein
MRYRIFYRLWMLWHCRLREHYGYDGYFHKSRPWHHMCCNGNAGGWRTRLCDWLERNWRSLEEV